MWTQRRSLLDTGVPSVMKNASPRSLDERIDAKKPGPFGKAQRNAKIEKWWWFDWLDDVESWKAWTNRKPSASSAKLWTLETPTKSTKEELSYLKSEVAWYRTPESVGKLSSHEDPTTALAIAKTRVAYSCYTIEALPDEKLRGTLDADFKPNWRTVTFRHVVVTALTSKP